MKKFIFIPLGICLLFFVLSAFYLYGRYLVQVEAQKELMVWYVSDTKNKLDIFNARIRELPHMVMPLIDENGRLKRDFMNLYAGNISQLKQFYTANHRNIKDISVYDKFGNVFRLYYENGSFIQDTYESRLISVLRSGIEMDIDRSSFSVFLPVYHGYALAGNVIISVDIVSLHKELFKSYLEKGDVWPTSILDDKILFTLPLESEWVLSHENEMIQDIQERKSGFFSGWIKNTESSIRIATYYESLKTSEHYLGIAFSSNISPLFSSFLWTLAIVFLILIVLAAVVSLALNRVSNQNMDTIKKREQEIRFFQTIYRHAPVGIILRKNNSFLGANDSLFALLDAYISPNDIGRDMKELGFPSDFFQQTDHDNESDVCIFEKKGHDLCLSRRQTNVVVDGVEYTLDALWDVTKLEHRVHSEITKSELLSRVSADVKKTLSNIKNTVTVLEQQYPEEQHIGYLDQLTDDLSGFIDDVQDYANIEAGHIVLDEMPFNLVEEIKKVTDLYRQKAQLKDIELRTHVASSVTRNVVGDSQRFGQILYQLLDNAVKFTNEGTIRISLETKELLDRKVMVHCSVEDTGQGMSHQELKNLFSFDLRTGGDQPVGLGVIIIKKLVGIMGGNLRVASPSPISTNPDTPGTQFLFSIICYSDQPFDKNLDYSHIVSCPQINILLITSDTSQMQHLIHYMKRKAIHLDVFMYNVDSSELLVNKLIIDKNRYQMVVIATAISEISFSIAEKVHQHNLTEDCLYVLADTYMYKGNYMKAKSLNIDYYFTINDDLSLYESILKTHFPNLSDKEVVTTDITQKGLQILIAENNVLSQTVSGLLFKNLGFETNFVQNALQLINQLNQKTYDVIFIDLKFPPSNGFEIAEMLRQKGYTIPIIAMTSTLTKENIKHITNSGMNGYVPKPLNPDQIKKILLKWFA